MSAETNLKVLLQTMNPIVQDGEYVFCTINNLADCAVPLSSIILFFREKEAITIIVTKQTAQQYHLSYSFIAAWITLTVHSSLAAVGLTSAFSTALAKHHISCNVVAAFYHDHIFVDIKDTDKAILVLEELTASNS